MTEHCSQNTGRRREPTRPSSPSASSLYPLPVSHGVGGGGGVTKHEEGEYQAFTHKALHPVLTQFTPHPFLQTPPRSLGDSTMLTVTSLLAWLWVCLCVCETVYVWVEERGRTFVVSLWGAVLDLQTQFFSFFSIICRLLYSSKNRCAIWTWAKGYD